MADLNFEVVDDELRTAARETTPAPWVEAVLEGKTVKVNLKQTQLGGYYKTFAKKGKKLRTRAAGDQTIVWCEGPKEKR